ncbi:hypothetical protein FS842_001235 [Serendipita sp. 407]|nr:hypothetical protein FS842_001235 [Serendipita sp. 407]
MKGHLSLVFIAVSCGLVRSQSTAGTWGQCGGNGWTGPTTCTTGTVCTYLNDWYYQCLPGTQSSTTTSIRPSSTSTTTSTRPSSTSTTTSSTSTSRSSSQSTSTRTSTSTRSSSTTVSTTTTTSSTTSSSSPTGSLSPAWQTAYTKAKAAVAKLSLSEKVSLGTGVQWQRGHCVGNTAAISTINFPGLCLQDGPLGIRFADLVSVFPAGINAAATFNRDLIQQRGAALGAEFKAKGINVALGPAMNIARIPAAGRNWEGFGGDPYLNGEAAFQTIVGIQSNGVQACAKHYINNEQEKNRGSASSEVDDRTEHEIYALPFLQSVRANVASVMCSYNKINGTYACGNDKTLNQILKTEFAFPGYVMSDWWAQMDVGSVTKGLDMSMPGDTAYNSGQTYFGQTLVTQVQNGNVPQSRIDDLATRILASWYYLGQDSGYPAVNFDSWSSSSSANQHVNVQGDHKTLIRKIAAASTVLLKNSKNLLPFNRPSSLAIIGSHAAPNPSGINSCSDRGCNTGVLAQGWGSGTAEYPYLSDPTSAIRTQATSDGTSITTSTSDTDTTAAANAARGKSAAIVFVTADSGEEYITVEGNKGDRNDLNLWHNGNSLISAVAAVNPNTVVVVQTVGQVLMEAWVDHPNVTSIVWSGLSGQEAGNALVDILYGVVNPSGRLPYTIAKSASDYPASISSASSIPYSEGLLVDYRWFDAKNIAPRYEFGFGLSYTTFSYASLSVSGSIGTGSTPSGPGTSVSSYLHDKVITVSFTLTNTGSRAGTEIAQLYISPPSSAGSPPYLLKGFESVYLAAGASTTVTIQLSRFDFSIWSSAQQKFVVPGGTHGITVGPSSRIRSLTGSLVV